MGIAVSLATETRQKILHCRTDSVILMPSGAIKSKKCVFAGWLMNNENNYILTPRFSLISVVNTNT
jgi:hypothetical protein